MTLAGFWPRGMVGRIAMILFAALVLELVGNVMLHRWQQRELISAGEVQRLAEYLVEAQQVATRTPRGERARRLHAASSDGIALNWVPRTVITDFSASLNRLAEMRERIDRAAPVLAGREIRLTILPSANAKQRDLVGVMQLDDGSFVSFRVSPYLAAPTGAITSTALHLLLMTGVLLAALLLIKALVSPLSALAHAADATGRGQAVNIKPAGPQELRRVATAFAAMQARLLRMIEDHSRAMISVSHDLRTPIQRLRLRSALIDDTELREQIAADLAEMEGFIGSTLAYVRNDEEEPFHSVDIAAIVSTAVDNAADAGTAIAYRGVETLVWQTRPLAFKRLLANLIANAERHATRIEISAESAEPDRLLLVIDDDGPGIPPDRRDEMLLPFRRMGQSGGAGLGLAICVRIVTALGGVLQLQASPLGGLRVSIMVERQRQ